MAYAQQMSLAREALRRVSQSAAERQTNSDGHPSHGNMQRYLKLCRYCGAEIAMRRLSTKGWLPFELAGERHVCDARIPTGPAPNRVKPTPHLQPSDPLLQSLDKQLVERNFHCSLCGSSLGSSIEKYGLFLRCTHCGRRHEISHETLNCTLQRLKVRCAKCGSLSVVRDEFSGTSVGCSRYPQCSRTDSWDHIRGLLNGRSTAVPKQKKSWSSSTQTPTVSTRESPEVLLQRRVNQIWEKVATDRVQKATPTAYRCGLPG